MKTEKIQVEAAMVFAAGTAVFMACLERGILVFSFFEQWRVLVFLALNLLLLAILFTSKSPIFSSSDEIDQETIRITPDDHKEPNFSSDGHQETAKIEEAEEKDIYIDEAEVKDIGEVEEELSMEELNERVEAFIAMFRQHLALDGMCKSSSKAGEDNVYKCNAAAAGGSNFRTCCFEGYSSLSATSGLRTVKS